MTFTTPAPGRSRRAAAAAALAAFALMSACGCAAIGGRTATTELRISGPPGTTFTARYQADSMSGDMTTSIGRDGKAAVFEFPGRPARCEVTRPNVDVQVGVEVRRAGNTVFRTAIPVHRDGVRLEEGVAGWNAKVF